MGYKEIKFTVRISKQWNKGQKKSWHPHPWNFKKWLVKSLKNMV